MTRIIIELITYSMPVLLAFGLIAGLLRFSSLDALHRMLLLYLAIALGTDLLSRFFGIMFKNNLLFIPLFGFLELGFFSWLYWRHFLKSSRQLIIISVVALAFIAQETFKLLWIVPEEFHAYSRVVDSIAIVFLCVLYFREMVNSVPLNIQHMRLNSGILLFFSLNIVFFIPLNFLINVPSKMKFYFWLINLLLTLLFYTFLIAELWKNGKTRTSSGPGY